MEKTERIQKVISQAGVASRRYAEVLIRAGKVSVNGKVITELGVKVRPGVDNIVVAGRPIVEFPDHLVFALNKPRQVITSLSDPEGRMTVKDLMKSLKKRLYPIGRLDFQSEGLILMTNDGDFAEKIMHPRYQIPKTYHVKVKGRPTVAQLDAMKKGFRDREVGLLRPESVKI